ncbi:rRNA processing protein [Dissophora ornata]|nr:rRNA processing protein [Dissophora ornata]
MPKSSSKRKKEKNADFKKTKLKVGKKKAVADNFTDTSFKSKGTTRSFCYD